MAILERSYDHLALEMVKSIRHADDAQDKVGARLHQFKTVMLTRAGQDSRVPVCLP